VLFLLISFSTALVAKQHTHPTLLLEQEAKIYTALGYDQAQRLEASGVAYADNRYYVVFDNLEGVARLCVDLTLACQPSLSDQTPVEGFEGITQHAGHFYTLVEAAQYQAQLQAKLRTYDANQVLMQEAWLPYAFATLNKGFEGISMVQRNGRLFLLALCEGNGCRAGKKSKKGRGFIQVFEYNAGAWLSVATLTLPKMLKFKDYSGLDLVQGRLAVVSQSSAKLWVGRLKKSQWEIKGEGRVYAFPQTKKGKILYCNVEGVAWLGPDRVVTVTDKRKKSQKKRCRAKDQSIQLFRLPE